MTLPAIGTNIGRDLPVQRAGGGGLAAERKDLALQVALEKLHRAVARAP